MAVRTDVVVDYNSSPRIITVLAPSTTITIQDLHDTLNTIDERPHNLSYPILSRSAGKQPLGGVVSVGITLSLLNAQLAFEARSGPSFVACVVSGGNLVAFDDMDAVTDPISPTAFTQVTISQSSSATIVGVGGSDVGDTAIPELSAIPPASPTLKEAIALLYMAFRNRITVTSSSKSVYKDDDTSLGSKSLSDDGSTYTEEKIT